MEINKKRCTGSSRDGKKWSTWQKARKWTQTQENGQKEDHSVGENGPSEAWYVNDPFGQKNQRFPPISDSHPQGGRYS